MVHHTLILLAVAGFLASCAAPVPSPPPQLSPRTRIVVAEPPPGPVKVDISMATQTAQLLTKTGMLLAEMDVSTGMEGKETPHGSFRVTEKLPHKRSNRYGQYVRPDTREVVVAKHWEHVGPKPPGTVYQGISMPWWMRLTADGVGMHVGGFARGEATSKGCIRAPEEGQQFFYQHCRVGTPVRIHGGGHPQPTAL